MNFALRAYTAPDFSKKEFTAAPESVWLPAPADAVAPEGYHAMSIFPEYFKIRGAWLLAQESRMDCVAVYEGGEIAVREIRLLKRGISLRLGARKTRRTALLFIRMASAKHMTGATCSRSARAVRAKPHFPGIMTSCTSCCGMSGSMGKSSG